MVDWNAAWSELSDEQCAAATTLGYTSSGWDSDANEHVPADDKYWAELSAAERAAAEVLGYTQQAWDEESC